jgi:LysR family transcriptional regulator, nitrogen assimilation regulatory protein
LDLKRLRYFVCIGELGSFTLAARRLGVAQPALSRHIRQLETECGAPLLRRNGRGAQLSELGRFVYEQARLLLEQMDRLESGLMANKGAPAGNVVVGMPPSVCMILVEPLFHRVRQKFPGIRLHICEGFSGDVREWLVAGRLDIGVLYHSGRAPNLIGSHLLVEDMFLCTAANVDEADGDDRTVSLADALRRELILPGRPHGLRILVDSVCAETGLTPNVVLELDSMATIKTLVRSSDAATILPYCGIYREVEQGQLAARRIVDASITRTLVVAETIRRPKTPATAAVVRCLREEVARLVDEGRWTGHGRHDGSHIADRPI